MFIICYVSYLLINVVIWLAERKTDETQGKRDWWRWWPDCQ